MGGERKPGTTLSPSRDARVVQPIRYSMWHKQSGELHSGVTIRLVVGYRIIAIIRLFSSKYQVPGILHILVARLLVPGTWRHLKKIKSYRYEYVSYRTYGYFTASMSRVRPQRVLHAALNAPCRYSSQHTWSTWYTSIYLV